MRCSAICGSSWVRARDNGTWITPLPRLCWQTDFATRPLVVRHHADRAAMSLHDGFADGESESGTIAVAVPRRVDAVEPVEQLVKMLRRDSRAGIVDGKDDGVSVPAHGNLHSAAPWRMPDRVRQQIAERTPQHQSVAEHAGRPAQGYRNRVL